MNKCETCNLNKVVHITAIHRDSDEINNEKMWTLLPCTWYHIILRGSLFPEVTTSRNGRAGGTGKHTGMTSAAATGSLFFLLLGTKRQLLVFSLNGENEFFGFLF